MSEGVDLNYWLFSNEWMRGDDDKVWGQTPTLKNRRYMLRYDQPNRRHVLAGDLVFMRVFGESIIGIFRIGSPWKESEPETYEGKQIRVGYFQMNDIQLWETKVPFGYVQPMLSNQGKRGRVLRLNHDDAVCIDTARHLLRLLELGEGGEETLILLENGIEEAVKANLGKLKMEPAPEEIAQQFSMGIGVGRSDLICIDDNGDYVVLEIKKDAAQRDAVGQVMTYKGWIQENLAKPGQKVHAAIVASFFDQEIRFAARAANIRLIRVRI